MPTPKASPQVENRTVYAGYRLPRVVQSLLSDLNLYHAERIDAAHLRRMLNRIPGRRSLIADTIAKCGRIMKTRPKEGKKCAAIIQMCLELGNIADDLPTPSFPIMRLPAEIRANILHRIIANTFPSEGVVPTTCDSDCGCPRHREEYWPQPWERQAMPTLLSTVLRQEYSRIFYRSKTFRFRCTCELLAHLSNVDFFNNVRRINVHWCGKDSAEAFERLADCPRLETLDVGVSKFTNTFLSARALSMKDFFPTNYRTTRIVDTNGLDELLRIRGLKSARAVRVARFFAVPESVEMERAALGNILKDLLTEPREEADDETPTNSQQ